jgi:hypothetical protein
VLCPGWGEGGMGRLFSKGVSGNPRGPLNRTRLTAETYSALLGEFPSATAGQQALLRTAARLLALAETSAHPPRALRCAAEARGLLRVVKAATKAKRSLPPAPSTAEMDARMRARAGAPV